jgi:hypothetical protein
MVVVAIEVLLMRTSGNVRLNHLLDLAPHLARVAKGGKVALLVAIIGRSTYLILWIGCNP